MCRVLMAIKPEYVDAILNGMKKFEYRKTKCKRDIETIVIYCTSPCKQVVGEVQVKSLLVDTPQDIWKKTKNKSGIAEEEFFDYFGETTEAVAYKLGKVSVFHPAKELDEFGIKNAPQSYVYIEDE